MKVSIESFQRRIFYSKLVFSPFFILINVLIDWFRNQFSFVLAQFFRAKAIKELNQGGNCDWLTSHTNRSLILPPCQLASISIHPQCVQFVQFIQLKLLFLHLHFPALIAVQVLCVENSLLI